MIEVKNLCYDYGYGNVKLALNKISMHIKPGQFVAVLGHNGSGKSSLVKHFNALLALQSGNLTVAGIDAKDEGEIWRLRRTVGMVFQNPDNQFVSSVVEEDVAFGLENYNVPRSEIPRRVKEALAAVGMDGFEKRSPHTLSGGQKQRVALAGVLALDPDILVFDEVTAMLDPSGRIEVLDAIGKLNRAGKTVIMITHFVEEAVKADIVYLMSRGKIIASGSPRQVLTDTESLAKSELLPPLAVRMYCDLRAAGIELSRCPLTNDELVEELCRYK